MWPIWFPSPRAAWVLLTFRPILARIGLHCVSKEGFGKNGLMASATHEQIFQARLKRIAAGGANTMSSVYAGNDKSVSRKSIAKAGKRRNRRSPVLQILNAFLIGAFSMVISRMVLFHLISEDGVYSEQMLGAVGVLLAVKIGDVALAALIALLALFLKKIAGQKAVFAVIAGIGLIMGAEIYVLKSAPDFYAAMYSPSYLHAQQAQNAG